MTSIEPVRRNPLQPVGPEAPLNNPAPVEDGRNTDIVPPVHSSNQTELAADHRELSFAVDPESDRVILRVIDEKTKDVVFQDPSDRILELAREMRQHARRGA